MTQKQVQEIIDWIKDYFKQNSFAKGAILGMSGGKDSLIVAKLCVEALGKDRVFGVIMPNGEMKDITDATRTCELLEISHTVINIKNAFDNIVENCNNAITSSLSNDSKINLAPRIRMSILYSIGQTMGYLVANTSNLSEATVGYTTKWGDNVGDFSPISNFTKTEVCEIGHLLGLPAELVDKTPSDGLSSKTDEEKLQITYSELDNLIRNGVKSNNYDRIMKLNKSSLHKRKGVARFDSKLTNTLKD